MGRRTTRRPGRQETTRPSNFFIIALAIGLILFLAMLVMIILRPPKANVGRLDRPAAIATSSAA